MSVRPDPYNSSVLPWGHFAKHYLCFEFLYRKWTANYVLLKRPDISNSLPKAIFQIGYVVAHGWKGNQIQASSRSRRSQYLKSSSLAQFRKFFQKRRMEMLIVAVFVKGNPFFAKTGFF